MSKNPTYHASVDQMLDEYALIEQAKKDSAKFEPLYNKYHEVIFRYIYQRLNDKQQAFDITSQVFLKALTNLKNYEFKGVPFSSWLYRIASNELNQTFRSQKAKRTVNIDTTQLGEMLTEITDETKDEQYNEMIKVLGQLEEDDLHLIEMRYFEKRPFKEIAEILEITENNAKVKVYRIIDKLKSMIKSLK